MPDNIAMGGGMYPEDNPTPENTRVKFCRISEDQYLFLVLKAFDL